MVQIPLVTCSEVIQLRHFHQWSGTSGKRSVRAFKHANLYLFISQSKIDTFKKNKDKCAEFHVLSEYRNEKCQQLKWNLFPFVKKTKLFTPMTTHYPQPMTTTHNLHNFQSQNGFISLVCHQNMINSLFLWNFCDFAP